MHAPQVSISDVLAAPANYEGQTVRIRGEVRELMNPRALRLQAGAQSMVVLTREPADPMGWFLQSGQHAIAVGVVRTGDVESIERDLERELEPEVRRAVRTAPVVIARSVGRVHGNNIDWTEPAGIRSKVVR